MNRFGNDQVNVHELVGRFWPYDGPYSDECTTSAALLIERLGRYLDNATRKPTALSSAAVAARVLAELHAAVCGYEQLLAQLVRFLDGEAESNADLYDDRYDRPGSVTARRAAEELRAAIPAAAELAVALGLAARPASHLGSRR